MKNSDIPPIEQEDLVEGPVPDGYLDRPEIRERIDWALAKIREGRVRPGKTAEELRAAFDELERMDPRP